MAEVEVRRARIEDAEAIARVHLRTWQAAYRHVFPPDQLDALPLERRIAGWQRGLRDDDGICFVAGDPILGFVFAEPCADEPGIGEVDAIYVDAAAWGTGVGRALLARAEEDLRARGFDEAVLWVIEDNPRARRFYEAAGWTLDGGRKTWPQMGVDAPVVRYRKRLAAY
jgi:ribosomal protein S18 acetylase RimI-like enzyme